MTKDEINRRFLEVAPAVALVAMRQFRISYDDAVEAVQQAYVRLSARVEDEAQKPVDASFDFRSYMLGAVRSYVFHERQRARTRQRDEALLWRAVAPEPRPDPETELITREESARLWEAIGRLNEPYRSIFNLLVGKELALVDVARQLGFSHRNIYTQYARGMRRLRKILLEASGNANPGGITS